MTQLRFGVLVVPDAPFPALVDRWRRVEELGFDDLFVADHYRHPGRPSLPWFDAWTALAAMAIHTSRVRIGPLVANPVLRGPAVLAAAAAAVDHLSHGRLELAIGQGVEESDHDATGTPVWSARERAARYTEYVQVVDGVLRSSPEPFDFRGDYHQVRHISLTPEPVQRPRPPITFGGGSPTVRRLAAERGDCWNTFALGDLSLTEVVDKVRRQNLELDQRCIEYGRRPTDLRRSFVLVEAAGPLGGARGLRADRHSPGRRRDGRVRRHVAIPEPGPTLEAAAARISALRHS